MSLRLSGINPLSYIGVEPLQPPNFVMLPRPPTSRDSQNFNIGTIWLNTENLKLTPPVSPDFFDIYVLVSLNQGIASWVNSSPASSTTYVEDSGSATPAGNILNIVGANGIITSGSGNTVTITGSGTGGASNFFFARQSATAVQVVGQTADTYSLGQKTTLAILYDDGGNVYAGDGAGTPASFTAPITGRYFLQFTCYISPHGAEAAATLKLLQPTLNIITTARTYSLAQFPVFSFINLSSGSVGIRTFTIESVVDMSMGDTATYQISCGGASSGGVGQYDILDGGVSLPLTWICGYLIA